MEKKIEMSNGEYVCIKATAQTQVIGLTRGDNTRSHHTENLDKGEVLVVQFTEKTSAIKIRGGAELYTKFGVIKVEK